MSKTHPIYKLKAVLFNRWRIRSDVRTIDGNRMLFVSYMTRSGAEMFIREMLREVCPEGYTSETFQMTGLHIVVIGRVLITERL